ncbi:hypothetical protein N0V90_007596 [Kalmusia sp. IMI 367209]|nr:hypothetical protein N0V90_007596 [Kalmusia sp. IMI 367209]
MPRSFKVYLIREHIGEAPYRGCSDFVAHMHDVTNGILLIESQCPPESTSVEVRTHTSVLDDISEAVVRYGYHRKLFNARKRTYTSPVRLFKQATAQDVRRSTLMVAIILGWHRTLQFLLETLDFKSVDWTSRYFGRPLPTAIKTRNTPAMKLFLSRGARLTYAQPQWNNYVLKIARKGDLEVIRTLLDFADQPAYQDFPWAWVVVDALAAAGRWEIIDLFAKKDWSNARDVWELINHRALECGREEVVRRMVKGLDAMTAREVDQLSLVTEDKSNSEA